MFIYFLSPIVRHCAGYGAAGWKNVEVSFVSETWRSIVSQFNILWIKQAT